MNAKEYFSGLKKLIDELDFDSIDHAMEALYSTMKSGKRIYFAGNGGSSSTASHAICDLVKGVNEKENYDIYMRAHNLSDNIPHITALGNDISYDHIFSEQIKRLADEGDALVVISVSGNSGNLVEAIKTAKEKSMTTIGFLGKDGGVLRDMVDYAVVVPTTNYGHAEDIHLSFCHLIKYYSNKRLKEEHEKESDISGQGRGAE